MQELHFQKLKLENLFLPRVYLDITLDIQVQKKCLALDLKMERKSSKVKNKIVMFIFSTNKISQTKVCESGVGLFMVIETVLANVAHVLNIFGSLFVLVNLVILQFIKKKEKM
jgi:hypothetical protein